MQDWEGQEGMMQDREEWEGTQDQGRGQLPWLKADG